MSVVLVNNAISRLGSALSSSATILSVSAGEGAKFPSPTNDDWFPLTLVKASGALEILRCVGRSGDVMTVVRGQESTAAQSFAVGDRIELRLTAGALNTVFGGSAVPQFAGMELSALSPYIDFHHEKSSADYTTRVISEQIGTLSILVETGRVVIFRKAESEFAGNITSLGRVSAKGGSIEIGNLDGSASIQINNEGKLGIKPAGGTYNAFGDIWTSVNFNPESKPNGDSVSTVGFINGDSSLPYFRRKSDNLVYQLQPALGFTPIQQGGGNLQRSNKIYIGHSDAGTLRAQVDNTDLGRLWTESAFKRPESGTFIGLSSGTVLPSGGSWAYHYANYNGSGAAMSGVTGIAAGGTTMSGNIIGFAWRFA